MRPAKRHLLTLGAILGLTTLAYSRISASYFCGFDDFMEVHRAAFEDKYEPAKIFTTAHFVSFKYRPFNRGLNLLTYLVSGNSALWFRIRNLVFHGLAVIAVYWLGGLLFHSYRTAAAAALLFAISPLTNQSVIGSVMTNTMANSLFLLSLALFIAAVPKSRMARLIAALVCGAIAVFTYESTIAGAGIMAVWLALDYLFHRRLPSTKFLLAFVLLGGLLYGSYLGARHFLVAGMPSAGFSRPIIIARNAILYAAGILVPIDPVLSADWFGTPMPKELLVSGADSGTSLAILIGACLGMMAIVVPLLFAGRKRIARWAHKIEWQPVLFLLSCMAISVLPLLLFTEHPSETYVYLPVAFFCLLIGRLLSAIPSGIVFTIALTALALLYGTATWVRNEDVARCAGTAKTILANLPLAQWTTGPWQIEVAKAPDEFSVMPYSFYNYYGLDSIGMPGYGGDAIECAMQLGSGNRQVSAEELTPEALASRCASANPREPCYLVHVDGRVNPFRGPSQIQPLSQ